MTRCNASSAEDTIPEVEHRAGRTELHQRDAGFAFTHVCAGSLDRELRGSRCSVIHFARAQVAVVDCDGNAQDRRRDRDRRDPRAASRQSAPSASCIEQAQVKASGAPRSYGGQKPTPLAVYPESRALVTASPVSEIYPFWWGFVNADFTRVTNASVSPDRPCDCHGRVDTSGLVAYHVIDNHHSLRLGRSSGRRSRLAQRPVGLHRACSHRPRDCLSDSRRLRAVSDTRALSASVSCVQPSNARAARDCRAVIMHDHLPLGPTRTPELRL